MPVSMAGAYAPITTPFEASGEVAYGKLAENVAKWAKTRLTGLVVLGSNGEGVFLTEMERRRVMETVREALPDDKRMVVGTGMESTYATARQNEVAAQVGADAVLVITPSYYRGKMDGPAMVRHYTALAEQSALPLFIYNMPGNTGIDLSVETVLEIAQHPNVIGVKDSSGNIAKIGAVIAAAPSHFKVYAGSASFLYPTVALGGVGAVMALGNIAPNLCAELYELRRGRTARRGARTPAQGHPSQHGGDFRVWHTRSEAGTRLAWILWGGGALAACPADRSPAEQAARADGGPGIVAELTTKKRGDRPRSPRWHLCFLRCYCFGGLRRM